MDATAESLNMSLSSYTDVFGIAHERVMEEVLPGDRVQTGTNSYPQYEVIALSADKVWLRDVQTGADHLAAADRCRKINLIERALAAE
jgi:RecG-like helicase